MASAGIDRRFFRFLAVGGLNTAFGYGFYALLLFLGLHYSVALLVATVAGVLFNFRTIGHFVFGNRDNSLLVRFFLVYALGYAIGVVAIRLLGLLGFDPYLAGACIVLPSACLSFFLMRALVFRPGRGEHPNQG
jgi:putative flippase GtrA